jgi:acetyl esterase/lipase
VTSVSITAWRCRQRRDGRRLGAALRRDAQAPSAHIDLRYGPRERNRIDFLKARDKAPTLLFIHGGYWQMRSKEFLPSSPKGRWRMASMSR